MISYGNKGKTTDSEPNLEFVSDRNGAGSLNRRDKPYNRGVGFMAYPYPVANLYPPVQAGAPDWRAYYTVNLLNLPAHYHNGGIWPFIGGMWVRFIHRLGLRDVACRDRA